MQVALNVDPHTPYIEVEHINSDRIRLTVANHHSSSYILCSSDRDRLIAALVRSKE
jgi:hypothetical protein